MMGLWYCSLEWPEKQVPGCMVTPISDVQAFEQCHQKVCTQLLPALIALESPSGANIALVLTASRKC